MFSQKICGQGGVGVNTWLKRRHFKKPLTNHYSYFIVKRGDGGFNRIRLIREPHPESYGRFNLWAEPLLPDART